MDIDSGSRISRLVVGLAAACVAWAFSQWMSGQPVKWHSNNPAEIKDNHSQEWRRIGRVEDLDQTTWTPDTTAVVLNWSRFHNILQISSVLCSPSLDGVISEVFIWNNNPKPLSYDVRRPKLLVDCHMPTI